MANERIPFRAWLVKLTVSVTTLQRYKVFGTAFDVTKPNVRSVRRDSISMPIRETRGLGDSRVLLDYVSHPGIMYTRKNDTTPDVNLRVCAVVPFSESLFGFNSISVE